MRRFFFFLVATFVVGCQDASGPTDTVGSLPSFAIGDATFGGNVDFFWLPPNVPNPNGDPQFQEGEFDPNFEPIARVCFGEAPRNDATECGPSGELREFLFRRVPTADAVSVKPGADNYIANWSTNGVVFDDGRETIDYHILVVLEDELLGFADVDIVPSPRARRFAADEAFVVVSNRTVPIKSASRRI